MKRSLLAICLVLAFVQAGFAAAKSSFGTAIMIKGTYVLLMENTHVRSWGTSASCPMDDLGNLRFYTAEGSSLNRELMFGTLTFDGIGAVSGTVTRRNMFNQDASNATASITCNAPGVEPTIVNGYMVLYPDETGIGSAGSYAVFSNGTGRWYIGAGSWLNLEIGGPPTSATGPWTSILIFETGCNDCSVGTAVLQQ